MDSSSVCADGARGARPTSPPGRSRSNPEPGVDSEHRRTARRGVVRARPPSRCRDRGGRVSTRRGAHPPATPGARSPWTWHRGRVFGDATAYERFMGRWSVRLAAVFFDAVGMAQPQRVLDLGCGTGSLTRAIAERWPALRGGRSRSVGPIRRGSTPGGRRPRTPGCASRCANAEAGCTRRRLGRRRAGAPRAQLRVRPRPGASPSCVACRTTRRGACSRRVGLRRASEMLRRLWDAAGRLDPSVVGQDEATMPVGRKAGSADLWRRCGLADVEAGGVEVSTRYGDFDDYWEPFLAGRARPASTSQACRMPVAPPCGRVAASVGRGHRPDGDGPVGARHQPGLTASGRPDGIRRVRRAGRTSWPGPRGRRGVAR